MSPAPLVSSYIALFSIPLSFYFLPPSFFLSTIPSPPVLRLQAMTVRFVRIPWTIICEEQMFFPTFLERNPLFLWITAQKEPELLCFIDKTMLHLEGDSQRVIPFEAQPHRLFSPTTISFSLQVCVCVCVCVCLCVCVFVDTQSSNM